jgi:hypothetical protein
MRTRAVVGAVMAAGLVSAAPAAALASTPSSSSSPAIIQVCLTVTPKSISLSINGTPIIGQSVAGLPRTCVGV